MDRQALDECAAFLGRDADDVLQLHERAELLPALLARIGLALSRGGGMDDAGVRFCAAIAAGWGKREFVAAQLLDWCQQCLTPEQREVMGAAHALCRLAPDASLTAQQLGIALKRLADSPPAGGARIVSAGERRGATRWVLRDSRD